MMNRVLSLAAALALSSCVESSSRAESFAPHETNPDLVGKTVQVYFGPDYYTIGTLLPDGRLRYDSGAPASVNWDLVHRVR